MLTHRRRAASGDRWFVTLDKSGLALLVLLMKRGKVRTCRGGKGIK
jgi:hypothetical protein